MSSPYNKPYNTVYFSGWQDYWVDINSETSTGILNWTAWRKWTDNSAFLNGKKPTHIGPWWTALSPSTSNGLNGEEFLTASAYKNLLQPWLTLENKAEDIFLKIKQYEAKFTIEGKAKKKWLTEDSVSFTGQIFEKEISYYAEWDVTNSDGTVSNFSETITIKVKSSINSMSSISGTCLKNSLREDGYHQEFHGLTNNSVEVISGNASAEILEGFGENSYSVFGPFTESTTCSWGVNVKVTHLSTSDGYVGDSQFAGPVLYDTIPFVDNKIIESLNPVVVESQIDKTYRIPYYRLVQGQSGYQSEIANSPELLSKEGVFYNAYPVEFIPQYKNSGSILTTEDWENDDVQIWPDTPSRIKTSEIQLSPRNTIKPAAIHNGKWQKYNLTTEQWELLDNPQPFSFTPPQGGTAFFPNEKELIFYGAKLSPWIEPFSQTITDYECNGGLTSDPLPFTLTTVPSESSYLVSGYWDQVFDGIFEMPDKSEEKIKVYLSLDKVVAASDGSASVIKTYHISADSEIPKITDFSIRPKKWFEFRNQNGLPVFNELTGEKINDPIKNPN